MIRITPRFMLTRMDAVSLLGLVVVGIVTLFVMALMNGCGVSPEAHVANVNEANDYAAELGGCRAKARVAKQDGGAIAYMLTYEECAEEKDAKHGVTFSQDGGR